VERDQKHDLAMIESGFPAADTLQRLYFPKIADQKRSESRDALNAQLLIARSGNLATYYAPFDHINWSARVAIVGLTPGRTQMAAALRAFQDRLASGADCRSALESAKYTASFGGPMRSNLVAMLDAINVNQWLGIPSCASLFSTDQRLAHHTSVLRYPVFKDGLNYSGSPEVIKTPFLYQQVKAWFLDEVSRLRNTMLIPLGRAVERVLAELAHKNLINESYIIRGLPHPSGANAERIAYFLGRKAKDALSKNTKASAIDSARASLTRQIENLLPVT
jgi:hypothetical protein